MATCLTSPHYLAAEALALLAAAGKAEFDVQAQVILLRSGRLNFTLTTWDPSASRNPLDCHFSYSYGDTAEKALAGLAEKLATTAVQPVYVVIGEAYKIAA